MNRFNYKHAIRNIFRNKLYAFINIIGLAFGSAFCILVYLFVSNEQSYDGFHKNAERLFRVELSGMFAKESLTSEKSLFSFLSLSEPKKKSVLLPAQFGLELKRNFPEIEDIVRFDRIPSPIIKANGQSFKEGSNIACADANFFTIFNFSLIYGTPVSVLAGRNNVVISERLAKKYFGTTNVMGNNLIIFGSTSPMNATIAGVMKNFPANSSMQFDLLFPVESLPDYDKKLANGINELSEVLVIKLKNNVNANQTSLKINEFGKSYFKPLEAVISTQNESGFKSNNISLVPFTEIHFTGAWGHITSRRLLYQLTTLAAVIIFIACFNYILLSLTNVLAQSKQVGIRKIIGASRWQIFVKGYLESQLLAIISILTGFVIALIFMPYFGSLTGSNLDIRYFSVIDIGIMLTGLALILGLFAGGYPTLVISGFDPLNILRGSTYRINPTFSKVLIIIQFSVCVVLVVSSLIIGKQMKFINEADLGFDKEQVVTIRNPYDFTDKQNSKKLEERVYHFVQSQPELAGFTATSSTFGNHPSNGFLLKGQSQTLDALNVDYDYFKFNNIPIILGRDFSRDIATDSAFLKNDSLQIQSPGNKIRRYVVVNQSLYKILENPPLDFYNKDLGAVIIGVCKDYHDKNLTQKIAPAYHTINADLPNYFSIKIKANQNIPKVLEKLRLNFDTFTNKLPFSYNFLDDEINKSYESYNNSMNVVTSSSILAICIAGLGLFGLSGITTINRAREIGIRKVLGANQWSLFVLLNRGTVQLALMAFVIATPIAWVSCTEWLKNFEYRITPGFSLLMTAGLFTMSIAIIAVSYHTFKSARSNPIKSLKDE